MLRALGVGKGDRVFTLLGRCPELYVTILGALRNGSVVSPLFSAFGPEPVATRLRLGDAHVLVTTRAMYRKKVADSRSALTSLKHVLLIDEDIDDDIGEEEGATATGFWRWMEATPDGAPIEPTTADDPALLLLRDQVDLDSMDWLNFLVGIHKRLHVDIPEADYRKLRTLADVVGYVAHLPAPDADLTAELEAVAADAHDAAHMCLAVLEQSLNSYDAEFTTRVDQADRHLKEAVAVVNRQLAQESRSSRG
ncbi:acetyl-CoA synthetase [Mycolicibacterium gilvum]|uniref:Acetyl-CoA synthetase n=1 Tax=Mycolicibacterium gilvum TaxID=1804 RepID=A0A378SH22_9MYCO|nr:acetyl-CoA synthetase [Mycolicibacterium gilvum]